MTSKPGFPMRSHISIFIEMNNLYHMYRESAVRGASRRVETEGLQVCVEGMMESESLMLSGRAFQRAGSGRCTGLYSLTVESLLLPRMIAILSVRRLIAFYSKSTLPVLFLRCVSRSFMLILWGTANAEIKNSPGGSTGLSKVSFFFKEILPGPLAY